mmetsp:Transcript_30726/g.60076  ORF Transcript_30726/g.60076 Transcript_30726/m.60076 type:complete len:96 (+) Transcript_30726:109-396(+)
MGDVRVLLDCVGGLEWGVSLAESRAEKLPDLGVESSGFNDVSRVFSRGMSTPRGGTSSMLGGLFFAGRLCACGPASGLRRVPTFRLSKEAEPGGG